MRENLKLFQFHVGNRALLTQYATPSTRKASVPFTPHTLRRGFVSSKSRVQCNAKFMPWPSIDPTIKASLLSTTTARSTHKIFKCTQSKNRPRSAKPSVYSPLKTLPLISNMYFSSYPLRHCPFQGHGVLSDRKNRNDARNERRELGPLPVGVLPLLWDDFRRTNIDKRSCHHRKHGSVNER